MVFDLAPPDQTEHWSNFDTNAMKTWEWPTVKVLLHTVCACLTSKICQAWCTFQGQSYSDSLKFLDLEFLIELEHSYAQVF